MTLALFMAFPLFSTLCAPEELRSVSFSECQTRMEDYTFAYWLNGWDRHAPREPALFGIRTGFYGLVLDINDPRILRMGSLKDVKSYETAVSQEDETLLNLPQARLNLFVTQGQTTYRCVRAAVDQKDWLNFPVRMIENGRFLQRCDLLQIVLEDEQGHNLPGQGRLEISAWPDLLTLLFEWTPGEEVSEAKLGISLGGELVSGHGEIYRARSCSFRSGETRSISLACPWNPAESEPQTPPTVQVCPWGQDSKLPVSQDRSRGWLRVELPKTSWSVADEPDRLERYLVVLDNPSETESVFRLLFDAPEGTPGITGISPMLRDSEGNPSGIPVQLSKNWHKRPERPMLYEGPWFHGLTLLRLPPQSRLECEFDLAHARWGGVPAASHAQLCLVGWGWNQLWDEAAIGSWGESICYEPDAIQRRCRIDDIRPLMVWGMNTDKGQWTWTHNVGGGDFLVYYDAKGVYQPGVGVKTAYLSQGPNLTQVVYAGHSADGCIRFRAEVSTPRCEDIHRTYHRFRYDVLKPMPFKRLAFYQVGADDYHCQQNDRMAVGNETGLLEEWSPERGGATYSRKGLLCPGNTPWISLHQAIPKDGGQEVKGAWACRGLVIRSWKARLGGHNVPPYASVFGTQCGALPGANIELSPPPGLEELKPGDYVEAVVELLILPMSADDYYGPNENLKASLREGGNTWRPVYRQAVGNRLEIKAVAGRVEQGYPLRLRADRHDRASLEVTGGLGYVPVTVTGLEEPGLHSLWMDTDGTPRPVDQSVHGNDFWQTNFDPISQTWSRTYNLCLDSPNDQRRTVRIQLEPGRNEAH